MNFISEFTDPGASHVTNHSRSPGQSKSRKRSNNDKSVGRGKSAVSDIAAGKSLPKPVSSSESPSPKRLKKRFHSIGRGRDETPTTHTDSHRRKRKTNFLF